MGTAFSQLSTSKKLATCFTVLAFLKWAKGGKPVKLYIGDQVIKWKVSSMNKHGLLERAAQLPCAPPKSLDAVTAPSPELVAFMEIMALNKKSQSPTFNSWRKETLPGLAHVLGSGPDIMSPVDAGVPSFWFTWPGVPLDSATAVLYFHGGGYIAGHPKHYRGWLGELSKSLGLPILAPKYRLAPENSIEDAVHDGVTAYQWLQSKGYKTVVAGDSAGGGLMMLVLQKLSEGGSKMPLCAVGVSPFCDLSMSGESNLENSERDLIITGQTQVVLRSVLGSCIPDLQSPSVSALFGDFTGLPSMLLLVGESECLRDDSTRAAEKARKHGVDVTLAVLPYVGHDFPCFCKVIPEGRDGLNRIASYVKARVE
eukprot:TRINITY_DN14379_c0_g1_i1.p1 TRINITY_DN14379_c0_g1~~TRINITY_DN14379_c0_g1_i1.p1  ORF type:complete len:369 (+),score=49.43 TRINITY_DN14379_c0_g1_i1:37-1143(+)